MLTAINYIHSNAYQKGSPGRLPTLVVPRGMSKSSNSCPSHTCQISVSLSCLRKPWRAAAPLPAEEQEELWRPRGPCAASRREGKVGLAPGLPPLWLRTWCEASGCRLPPPAYDVRVCRILLSEQVGFEKHCSAVCAVYFCKGQGLLPTVPAGHRTEKNPGNHSHVAITLSLPSSH